MQARALQQIYLALPKIRQQLYVINPAKRHSKTAGMQIVNGLAELKQQSVAGRRFTLRLFAGPGNQAVAEVVVMGKAC